MQHWVCTGLLSHCGSWMPAAGCQAPRRCRAAPRLPGMSDLAGQHKEARSLILALRERVEQLEKTERV